MNDQPIPQLLTLSQASKLLSVHPNTLRQWDKKGILEAVRFGQRKDRRYKKDDILRLLQNRDKP
jgi:excisionase family DNA binding protein